MLVQSMQYAAQRLDTLNEFCVVCDERHLFENSSMLKVCSFITSYSYLHYYFDVFKCSKVLTF